MKTFQADTMQEALSKVKDEMGPDAVILKSRKTTRKAGVKTVPCFEVTAALEESLYAHPAPRREDAPESRPAAPARPAKPGQYDWTGSLRRVNAVNEEGREEGAEEAPEAKPDSRAPAPRVTPQGGSLVEILRNEFRDVKDRFDQPTREIKVLKQEIKAMIEAAAAARPQHPLRRSEDVPAEGEALQAALIDMDIEPEYAAELARMAAAAARSQGWAPAGLCDHGEVGERAARFLADTMAGSLRVTGGIRLRQGRPAVVALVGPTGVGKTTTLAKLAALAKLQGRKVGIVSADNFRMGAAEQLDVFGKAAGIPVRAVFSPADAGAALRAFSDRDLILIDTAGRGHAGGEAWRELQALLRALAPDEIHLVLSATTRMRELRHQYAVYSRLDLEGATGSLVFTKLDECLSLGCVYNLARRMRVPLAYLCNGQVVPDHIVLADAGETARAVIAAGSGKAAAASALRLAGEPAHAG